jgi:hypothetical protein
VQERIAMLYDRDERNSCTPETPRPASVSAAVDLMTAWLDSPDGPPDLLIARLGSYIEGRPDRNQLAGAVELVMGMKYLCGSLLALREHETGISMDQTVRDLALQYAQD